MSQTYLSLRRLKCFNKSRNFQSIVIFSIVHHTICTYQGSYSKFFQIPIRNVMADQTRSQPEQPTNTVYSVSEKRSNIVYRHVDPSKRVKQRHDHQVVVRIVWRQALHREKNRNKSAMAEYRREIITAKERCLLRDENREDDTELSFVAKCFRIHKPLLPTPLWQSWTPDSMLFFEDLEEDSESMEMIKQVWL